jgi:hypothetical protein
MCYVLTPRLSSLKTTRYARTNVCRFEEYLTILIQYNLHKATPSGTQMICFSLTDAALEMIHQLCSLTFGITGIIFLYIFESTKKSDLEHLAGAR